MKQPELHRVEILILDALRRTPTARFSELMKPTGLQSDSFKFYLRRLKELGHIEKDVTGKYALTTKGKEFANNLDERTQMIQKQPKLSMLIIAPHPSNPALFLVQRRLRHPYHGFYGTISGPVQWGEEIETTATREIAKQTGLAATCTIIGFYRQKDREDETGTLLEDKLFAVVEATVDGEMLSDTWPGGHNQWMTIEEYQQQTKRFASTLGALHMRSSRQSYDSEETVFRPEEY